jgi:hypothetical protein
MIEMRTRPFGWQGLESLRRVLGAVALHNEDVGNNVSMYGN